MRIVTARRISQAFFLLLLVWFCVVSTSGEAWFEKRGWPVNWLLQLDPLAAVGVALAAGALTLGMLWAMATVVLTALFGRVFCGWICPFGSMHQAIGWLARRGRPVTERIALNRYRRGHVVKVVVLGVMLGAAAAGAVTGWSGSVGSLLTGVLDPIPLVTRSINLVVLPLADRGAEHLWTTDRFAEGAWLVGAVFIGALAANLWVPRFFCRFICPLGALLGLIGRVSIFRIGKRPDPCTTCGLCERDCEGGCEPAGRIHASECVMCLNCIDQCRHDAIGYGPHRAPDEIPGPDLSRRGVLVSLAGGLAAAPLLRMGGALAANWPAKLIRPPGSLTEAAFLNRCIKCGQCMRVCPTNVLQPAGAQFGVEALWTPVLNNRIGTSGCQYNCVACGHICPTGAIRPVSLAEKLGEGDFAERGPIRIGTAFVDRGRCLPWAMNTPCIVCQENCPVSPKAITIAEVYEPARDGQLTVAESTGDRVTIAGAILPADQWATGDAYLLAGGGQERRRIVEQASDVIRVDRSFEAAPEAGSAVVVQIKLQRPQVGPGRCIGCGVCEHECPVSGQRAIRVTADNETRCPDRSLLL